MRLGRKSKTHFAHFLGTFPVKLKKRLVGPEREQDGGMYLPSQAEQEGKMWGKAYEPALLGGTLKTQTAFCDLGATLCRCSLRGRLL